MLRITIEVGSSLMLGSGTGRGSYIDSDIIVDDFGLPFFPARRLKGLLRESALELIEMLQQAGWEEFIPVSIEQVFGSSIHPAAIRVNNLYPPDYEQTIDCLNYIRQEFPQLINKEAVTSALTDIRQQTAIDKKGYAQKGSLRSIRVLKKPYSFLGDIEVLDLELKAEIEVLLALACLNLKRVGSSRNRGWGEISCTLCSEDGRNLTKTVVEEFKEELKKGRNLGQRPSRQTEEASVAIMPNKDDTEKTIVATKGYSHKLEYIITNTAPLLFTSPDGDENMVITLDYIPGTALHGYYANQLIKSKGIKPDQAQEDEVFHQCFLEGKLGFSNAYLIYNGAYFKKQLYPTPLFIHTNKQRDQLFNLIEDSPADSQAVRGYACIEDGKLIKKEPEKTINFHLLRNANSTTTQNRIDGHGKDESIFHYQSIEAGQEFHGYLLGSEDKLKAFQDYFGDKSQIRLGRSINTQYGSCRIEFGEIEKNTFSLDDSLLGEDENSRLEDNHVLLYFISPVVLYNDYGYTSVSTENLARILEQRLGLDEGAIELLKSFAREMESNSFVTHWKMPEPVIRAWAPGSSFLLQFKVDIDESLKKRINALMRDGLGDKGHMGLGQLRFVSNLPEVKEYYDSDAKKEFEKPGDISPLAERIIRQTYADFWERIVLATATRRASEFHKKNKEKVSLSSNLLGRLERMVQDAQNPEDLAGKIRELRGKAANPLYEMKLNHASLFEELTNMKLEDWCRGAVENEWKLANKLQEEFDIKQDASDLFRNYWQAFLRTLRQLYKAENIAIRGRGENAE